MLYVTGAETPIEETEVRTDPGDAVLESAPAPTADVAVGAGVGVIGGAAAGAVIGSGAGPVGTVIGAVVGAAAGATAGGLMGEAIHSGPPLSQNGGYAPDVDTGLDATDPIISRDTPEPP